MTRNKLTRRQFLRSLGVTAGGVVLASCAPKATPTAVEEVSEATPAAEEEAFTLRLLTFLDLSEEATKKQYDYAETEWKKLYPNGELDHEAVGWDEIDTKTVAYATAGTPLDIGANWGGVTPNWATMGIVAPLDDIMPQWWWDQRWEPIVKPPCNSCHNGKVYLASQTRELCAMVIRKDVFEQAGVDLESLKNFDDWLVAGDTIVTKTEFKKPFSLGLKSAWAAMDFAWLFFMGNGLDNVVDFRQDGSEEEAYIEAITYFKRWMEYCPEDCLGYYDTEMKQGFLSNVIAQMFFPGQWFIGEKDRDPEGILSPEKTTILPYPYGPHSEVKEPYYFVNATGYFLMSGSEHKEAAANWIAIATSTDTLFAHLTSNIPPTNDWTWEEYEKATAWPDIMWWQQLWVDLCDKHRVHVTPGFAAREEIAQRFYEDAIKLWYDEMTPEELYSDMREFAVPLLEEVGG